MSGPTAVGRDAWLLAWHSAPHAHQTAAEQTAIVAFALYADPATGEAIRPAQATVAAKLGLSVSTVGRAIRQAVRDGWFIEVSSGRGRSVTSCYRLASRTVSSVDLRQFVAAAAADANAAWLTSRVAPQ